MPWIDRDQYRLFYTLDGNPKGPLLVLSHSLGANLRMWEPQVEALGSRFRLLRYDHPGHGRSRFTHGEERSESASASRPAGLRRRDLTGPPDATAEPGATASQQGRAGAPLPKELSISDLGWEVLALLDHLGVEEAFFCGLSLGGMVGMWLGAHAPVRIRKLVISNTADRIEQPELLLQRIESIRRAGLPSISESVVSKWFTDEYRARRPRTVSWAREMLLETHPEGYAVLAETVSRLDLREDLEDIDLPCLVIYGELDQATPPAHSFAIHEKIRNSKLAALDCAHLANLEKAEEFGLKLIEFFRDEG